MVHAIGLAHDVLWGGFILGAFGGRDVGFAEGAGVHVGGDGELGGGRGVHAISGIDRVGVGVGVGVGVAEGLLVLEVAEILGGLGAFERDGLRVGGWADKAHGRDVLRPDQQEKWRGDVVDLGRAFLGEGIFGIDPRVLRDRFPVLVGGARVVPLVLVGVEHAGLADLAEVGSALDAVGGLPRPHQTAGGEDHAAEHADDEEDRQEVDDREAARPSVLFDCLPAMMNLAPLRMSGDRP